MLFQGKTRSRITHIDRNELLIISKNKKRIIGPKTMTFVFYFFTTQRLAEIVKYPHESLIKFH